MKTTFLLPFTACLSLAVASACGVSDDSPTAESRDVITDLDDLDEYCPLVEEDFPQCVDDLQQYTFRTRYTLDEVITACENTYDNGQQIDQCIMNVCGYYGCAGW